MLGVGYFVNNIVWNSSNSASYIVDVADTFRCYNNDVDKQIFPSVLHPSGNSSYEIDNISIDPLLRLRK